MRSQCDWIGASGGSESYGSICLREGQPSERDWTRAEDNSLVWRCRVRRRTFWDQTGNRQLFGRIYADSVLASFFTALGFDVLIPRDDVSASLSEDGRAWETVPSESVCFPAKISHIKYFDLVHRKADIVFMPKFNCCGRCPVMCGYAEALFDNLTDDLPPLAMPLLASEDCEAWVNDSLSRAALRKVVSDLAQQAGLGLRSGEFSLAIDAALEEQRSFDARLQAETSGL